MLGVCQQWATHVRPPGKVTTGLYLIEDKTIYNLSIYNSTMCLRLAQSTTDIWEPIFYNYTLSFQPLLLPSKHPPVRSSPDEVRVDVLDGVSYSVLLSRVATASVGIAPNLPSRITYCANLLSDLCRPLFHHHISCSLTQRSGYIIHTRTPDL